MSAEVVTMAAAEVPADRADAVLAAYVALLAQPKPDGLLATSLLRDGDEWMVVTRWRDRAAVLAMRAAGERPAAVKLFEDAGARVRVAVYDVVAGT